MKTVSANNIFLGGKKKVVPLANFFPREANMDKFIGKCKIKLVMRCHPSQRQV